MPDKIILLGGGESGVGAAVLAKVQGADAFLSDGGTLRENYREMLREYNIPFEEGGHSMERILAADLIVKSPGIPEKTPVMEAIRAAGKRVVSEIEYGWMCLTAHPEYADRKPVVIGITGSNGKTTTTSLIYHMLLSAGEDVCLGGNIGISFAYAVATQPLHDFYVLEISSFQLDDVAAFAPHVAVLTNITPDHLDRYHYDIDEYAASKMRIQERTTDKSRFICMAGDPITERHLALRELNGMSRFSLEATDTEAFAKEDLITLYTGDTIHFGQTQLMGQHNVANIMAATLAVARAYEAAGRAEAFDKAVGYVYDFQPIEHRLEPSGTIRGVRYLNDSKATNVDAVVYALGGVPAPILWIAGGVDKGNDYAPLLPLVHKIRALVILGEGKEALHAMFDHKIALIEEAGSMQAAVEAASRLAQPGDTVLLSPACASFDLFKNYEDRGRQFKACVGRLS